MNIPDEEQVEDPCEFMSQLANTHLPLKQWGFEESYRTTENERLIFDSKWCRIKFVWQGWEMRGGNTISIFYGRLHAPNNDVTINWNKQDCYCWHREELALHYLDNTMPDIAAKSIHTHDIIKRYRQSDIGVSLGGTRRQPEWLIRMHAMIWEEYCPRLFELFDLEQTELWGKYQNFVRDVYNIKGRNPVISPPLDQIC
jgi:hypothetical protein